MVGDEPYIKLEILPIGADFEGTTTYRITLSEEAYARLANSQVIIDRPILGTKVSIYLEKNY